MDEFLIAAYEFNSAQPRYYSKFLRKKLTGFYDVYLREAAAASSSAPIYFDPKPKKNLFDIEELLVDGGIICNNPAFYAYMMAKYLKN